MILEVKIKTGAKIQTIQKSDNFVKISLKSQPIEGKANLELIKLLSKRCSLPKSSITIKSGLHSKNKLINIDNISQEELDKCLFGADQ